MEFKILFDEDLRNTGPSPEELFSVLKRKLSKKFDSDVKLVIKEVDKFDKKDPYFITKIDRVKYIKKKYLV